MQPMPTPYAPPPRPAPKSSKVWLYALIGCGGLAVAGVIIAAVAFYFIYYAADQAAKNPVRFAAKLVEAANPDIEVVSVDEEKRLVTFRDKKTGATTTVSLEEFQQEAPSDDKRDRPDAAKSESKSAGASAPDVSVTDKDNIPSWAPLYPGAKIVAKVTTTNGDKASGTLTLATTDSADAVLKFYESKLGGTGFSVTRAAAGGYRAIVAKRDSGETVTVMAFQSEDDGERQDETGIQLSYQRE